MSSSSPAPTLSCRVSGYVGAEAAVLAVRNANRDVPQSGQYLEWRYGGVAEGGAPRIFWLDDDQGKAAGMAAMIPRAYWIDGKSMPVGVLGDISVDANRRGRGLGKHLLGFATQWMEQHDPPCRGLVIPTPSARRALEHAGWRSGGKLLRHVLVLDPAARIANSAGSGLAARIVSSTYRFAVKTMLWSRGAGGCRLMAVDDFDASFDTFWRTYAKHGLRMADRSASTLRWRYSLHPLQRFQVAKLLDSRELAGYVVYEVNADNCMVYDILAGSVRHLRWLLAQMARRLLMEGIHTVTVTLSDRHPYRPVLRRMGFVSRDDDVFFQFLDPGGVRDETSVWALTQGDKDI